MIRKAWIFIGAPTVALAAGDTFNGALAAALARGEPLREAMRGANAAAALSVTGRGAIGGMPRLDEVAALLGQPASSGRSLYPSK